MSGFVMRLALLANKYKYIFPIFMALFLKNVGTFYDTDIVSAKI